MPQLHDKQKTYTPLAQKRMQQHLLQKHNWLRKLLMLTLSARHPFQNFSTPCILNVNNTGAKQRSIMK
jgi:hypothetical protein